MLLSGVTGGGVPEVLRRPRGIARAPGPRSRRGRRPERTWPPPSARAPQRRSVVKIGSALLVEAGAARSRRPGSTLWPRTWPRSGPGQRGDPRLLRRHRARPAPLGLARALRLEEKQAAAAAGQIRLAHAWRRRFPRTASRGAGPADPRRYGGPQALSQRAGDPRHLLELRCVPVINENDTVATTEIRFGDNDRLAARVAEMIRRTSWCCCPISTGSIPPTRGVTQRRAIPARRATHPGDRGHGRRAAARLLLGRHGHEAHGRPHRHEAGCRMAIAMARLSPLNALAQGARCTWFIPAGSPRPRARNGSPARWQPAGTLTVDDGAPRALACGKSLLPAGVAPSRAFRARRCGRASSTGRREGWRAAFAHMQVRTPAALPGHRSDEIELPWLSWAVTR